MRAAWADVNTLRACGAHNLSPSPSHTGGGHTARLARSGAMRALVLLLLASCAALAAGQLTDWALELNANDAHPFSAASARPLERAGHFRWDPAGPRAAAGAYSVPRCALPCLGGR